MSEILKDLLYSDDHEWVKKLNDEEVLIGITDYAVKQLGSIVFVDLPEVGDQIEAQTEFGAVESVKAASDLLSPISGEVLEVNEDVIGEPEMVNEDAYGTWFIKVKLQDPKELDKLLSAKEYEDIL
ncbi:MAG: glycine cleavage system protein H [Tenericutes bacterium 4572_104]|nr:MAG: glycine cleavage system protein H [Tenericutes bacterium 4572_104]